MKKANNFQIVKMNGFYMKRNTGLKWITPGT